MILHTPLPCDMIMGYEIDDTAQQMQAVNGVNCMVRGGRIERLVSTDPRDYLNPNLSPGRAIE